MRNIMALTALSLVIGTAAPALASEEHSACGSAPREQWLSEEAIKAKASELGYQVRRVKIEDNCYEVYAIDPQGGRAEVYFNPATGEVARTERED